MAAPVQNYPNLGLGFAEIDEFEQMKNRMSAYFNKNETLESLLNFLTPQKLRLKKDGVPAWFLLLGSGENDLSKAVWDRFGNDFTGEDIFEMHHMSKNGREVAVSLAMAIIFLDVEIFVFTLQKLDDKFISEGLLKKQIS